MFFVLADKKRRAAETLSGLSAEGLGEDSRQSQPGNMQMYSRGEENGPENRESGRDVVRGFESYHLRFMLMYSRG